MKVFRRLLVNSLISGVTSTFLWFAVTFWVYLETRSVVATSVIAGAFGAASALLGVVFGTFVDRHRKKTVMLVATGASLVCYLAATIQYAIVDQGTLLRLSSPQFWLFVAFVLTGSVAGSMRSIALSTCVTLLVEPDRRDRANGMVGTVTGVSFAITSVFSGLVVGQLGMGWALCGSLLLTEYALLHLTTLSIPEPDPQPEEKTADDKRRPRFIDIASAVTAIRGTPGLMVLILFSSFNNLLGGVFMSLMDAYGLSLVSVETWGLLWGVLSFGFIAGGLIVAKRGLGPRPMQVIVIGNLINWSISTVFAVRSSIVMLAVGMFIWLMMMPIVEAAEQTVLQRAVPFEKQGRVFGLAQTIENLASPITAFAIGPIAEAVFIPYMTDGGGVDLIGGWFGTGKERGIALIFTLAGVGGVIVTMLARSTRSYRLLSANSATANDAALGKIAVSG